MLSAAAFISVKLVLPEFLLYDLDGGGGAVAVGGALQVEACCGSSGQFAAGEVIVAGVNNLCTNGELIDASVGGIVDIDDF